MPSGLPICLSKPRSYQNQIPWSRGGVGGSFRIKQPLPTRLNFPQPKQMFSLRPGVVILGNREPEDGTNNRLGVSFSWPKQSPFMLKRGGLKTQSFLK